MLDSTIELISLAASNSLAVFCFCNLIIAILLVGSSKPTPRFDEVKPNDDIPTIVENENFKKNTAPSCDQKVNNLIQTEKERESSVSIDMVDNEEDMPQEDEDDGDDELRKRVEEFIEKINKGWMAEKQRTYSLLQQHC